MELLPYSPDRDVYRLLRIEPRAGRDEVVVACRRLARTFHPDRNASPLAHQEMQVVNVVRGLLTDPAARAEYDIARLRFLTMDSRRSSAEARARSWATQAPRLDARRATAARPSAVVRNARAAWSGLRATLAELGPSRCSRCRSVIGQEDAFCALCGQRLRVNSAGASPLRSGRDSVRPRRFSARSTPG